MPFAPCGLRDALRLGNLTGNNVRDVFELRESSRPKPLRCPARDRSSLLVVKAQGTSTIGRAKARPHGARKHRIRIVWCAEVAELPASALASGELFGSAREGPQARPRLAFKLKPAGILVSRPAVDQKWLGRYEDPRILH
ncbi:hypothetical protein ACG7TL_008141 [Trametes sanguinea]